jgi:chromosome segregation ATPase
MEDNKSLESIPQMPEGCSAATLRELRGRAQAAIESQRRRMDDLERQLKTQLEDLQNAIAEQLVSGTAEAQQAEQTYEDARSMRKELEQAQAAWQQEQEKINAAIADQQQELDRQNTELDKRAEQFEAREKELAEREQAIAAAQQELDSDRAKQSDSRDQELSEREKATVEVQKELENERAEAARQKSEWDTAKAALEAERAELQNKFDLALGDVQRLRRRVAELEQDLASRPDVDDGDSAELVHLRAERDALVERIEELEQQPAPQVDSDSQRQLNDLQRRFEMAVEDVRELKTLNAKLEARLAEAEQRAGSKADSGAMDWESQKRRLLDTLSDTNENDPAAQKERATIEGTIRITDDVVAKKDDEIDRLREKLSTAQADASSELDGQERREADINKLIDADEIVQQHRKKLAQLEKEMEEKLRAAELELSVERAKIARKQVELNDWRAELEAMQESHNSNSEGGGKTGTPKRRWLAKLGLGSDDEQQ